MTAPCTLLKPLLLLAIIACSSAQFGDTTAPTGDKLASAWSATVKPQTGACGDIAAEWQIMKHHVKSMHDHDGSVLEKLSHHVREMTEHIQHLTERVNNCQCGGDEDRFGAEELIKEIGAILKMSMLFYEAQRSGQLPTSNQIPWRQNAGMEDVGYNQESLTGGWYEGATGVKSTLPMAFSTTVLIIGMLIGGDAYRKTGLEGEMYDSIKWPLDYFMKCHTAPGKFYIQVDEAFLHEWMRPEHITIGQPAYLLNETGSGVAADTAAALAAGSMIFRDREPDYADKMLQQAREWYKFAYMVRRPFEKATALPNDIDDELAWGALWLRLATEEEQYVEMAKEFMTFKVPETFSYLDKTVGAQLIYSQVSNDTGYREAVERFLWQWFTNSDTVKYSPRGLAVVRPEGGSIGYAVNAALIAVSAAHFGIMPEEGIKFARSQLEYILGVGEHEGRSFVVGYGRDWPQHARHAASACNQTCKAEDQAGPNAHMLIGAVVSGPGLDDAFPDVRTDWLRNNVSITYNAGFQSTVAAILGSLLKMEEFGGDGSSPGGSSGDYPGDSSGVSPGYPDKPPTG